MPRLIKTASIALALTMLVLLSSYSASAYEFHMLGGMVIKGGLKGFQDGVFHVESEFGGMTVNAANLDYIIVEETDAAGPRGALEGALEFGMPCDPEGRTVVTGIEKVNLPLALAGHSLSVSRMRSLPVTPSPLGSWSVSISEAAKAYPGRFRGTETATTYGRSMKTDETAMAAAYPGTFRGGGAPAETVVEDDAYPGQFRGAAPEPLGSWSVIASSDATDIEDYPAALRITRDDLAGAYLELGGIGESPDPLDGYTIKSDEQEPQAWSIIIENTATATYRNAPKADAPQAGHADELVPLGTIPRRTRPVTLRTVVIMDTESVSYDLTPPTVPEVVTDDAGEDMDASAGDMAEAVGKEVVAVDAAVDKDEPAGGPGGEGEVEEELTTPAEENIKDTPTSKSFVNSFQNQLGSDLRMSDQDEYWWHKLEGKSKKKTEEAGQDTEAAEEAPQESDQ